MKKHKALQASRMTDSENEDENENRDYVKKEPLIINNQSGLSGKKSTKEVVVKNEVEPIELRTDEKEVNDKIQILTNIKEEKKEFEFNNLNNQNSFFLRSQSRFNFKKDKSVEENEVKEIWKGTKHSDKDKKTDNHITNNVNNVTTSELAVKGGFLLQDGFSTVHYDGNFKNNKVEIDSHDKKDDGFKSNYHGFNNNFDNNSHDFKKNGFIKSRPRNNQGGHNNYNKNSNNNRPRKNNNFGGNNDGFKSNFNRLENLNNDYAGKNYRGGIGSRHIEDYNYYKDNKDIIDSIIKVFCSLDENKVIEILKVQTHGQGITIFELLNEFSKENIISKNKNETRLVMSNQNFTEKVSILEKHERDISAQDVFMIKSFKTKEILDKENSLDIIENYSNSSDRRRKVMKNIDGYFNYIPILCNIHKNTNVIDGMNDTCNLAHNDYEINFHPLNYKTSMCNNKNCNKYCPNCHELHKDFRKIYDYSKKEIVELAINFEANPLIKSFLRSYTSILEYPTEFSLETFKVLPCRLSGQCGIDSHLCFGYHDIKERRRPPRLFQLLNEVCPFAQPDKNSDFYPQICIKGDHCDKFHTRYELVYYPDNFRKIKQCVRQPSKITGKCPYILTCYGIHKENTGM